MDSQLLPWQRLGAVSLQHGTESRGDRGVCLLSFQFNMDLLMGNFETERRIAKMLTLPMLQYGNGPTMLCQRRSAGKSSNHRRRVGPCSGKVTNLVTHVERRFLHPHHPSLVTIIICSARCYLVSVFDIAIVTPSSKACSISFVTYFNSQNPPTLQKKTPITFTRLEAPSRSH